MAKDTVSGIEKAQRNEITEYLIYSRLASRGGSAGNRKTLARLAAEELKHYNLFKGFTGRDIAPDRFKYLFYVVCSRCFGLSFALRLMEKGEESAQENYSAMTKDFPAVIPVLADEEEHEAELLDLINEEALEYTGSVVLGLNDALVELTGALAGFTLALQKSSIIAVVGVITGIAAGLSMAAAEYLSTKEEGLRSPVKASLYTGIAYLITVGLLIIPFLLLKNPMVSLAITMVSAIVVIFVFNYYISVAKDRPFTRRFVEMAAISLGVAAINYAIGLVLRKYIAV
jgi:VIT1/CCC1 family predicted Fe2+/Mn2+ transporter